MNNETPRPVGMAAIFAAVIRQLGERGERTVIDTGQAYSEIYDTSSRDVHASITSKKNAVLSVIVLDIMRVSHLTGKPQKTMPVEVSGPIGAMAFLQTLSLH